MQQGIDFLIWSGCALGAYALLTEGSTVWSNVLGLG